MCGQEEKEKAQSIQDVFLIKAALIGFPTLGWTRWLSIRAEKKAVHHSHSITYLTKEY